MTYQTVRILHALGITLFLSSNTQWASNNPIKTEIDYEISDVAQLQIGSKIKTVDAIHEVVKITEIEAEQKNIYHCKPK